MPKTITKEILEWSENFLEIPSKKLGGWSVCPYAKAARLKNEVKIVEVEQRNKIKNLSLLLVMILILKLKN